MTRHILHIGLALIFMAGTMISSAAWAGDDLATFAERKYRPDLEAEAHEHALSTCKVCGAQRVHSRQMIEILGGRYEFENVEQAYCPVCHVTTLNLEKTPRSTRFVRLLWWKVPASRTNVVRSKTRFAMALTATPELPFISGISGLKKQADGQIYFMVE